MIDKPAQVSSSIQRSTAKSRKYIIDWKYNPQDLEAGSNLLDELIKHLSNNTNSDVYVKVPASHLCKNVNGKPYILSLANAKKIIVEMYGEDPAAYKDSYSMFLAEIGLQEEEYPDPKCPRFPSLKQLSLGYPQIEFYIEKTLRQEEPGFLGEQLDSIL